MDWTGGVRRRFAAGKKKNSVLQKQKAHFAKARAALQDHDASRSPFAAHFHERALSTHSHKRQHSLHSHGQGHEDGGIAPSASPQRREFPDHRHSKSYTPSVVYISSDHETPSVSSSPRHPAAAQLIHQAAQNPPDQSPDMEERLLLAHRRNLLARSDWLGLAPLRPVQMKFASCTDRDRVGKRRKISKSGSRRAKPAEKHSMIQPFRRHGSQSDRSLRPYDIAVRIGTDALKSQTLRSNLSPVVNRTVRAISTEFGSLSEEPMLLDAEEDLHQPIWDPQGLMSFDQRRDTPEPSSLAVIRGSQMMDDYGGMPANVRSIEMRQRLPSHVETLLERPTPGYERGESPAKDFEDSRTSNKYQADVQLSEPPDQLRITLVRTAANAEDDKLLFTAASEAQSEDSQSDDEELWREILKIKHPPSSHHSLRALHSASAHIATSDSHIDHPELQHFIRALNGGDNSVGGVVRPDDQPSMTDRQHDEGLKEGIPKAPSPMQSPSTSFHQIETLARHKTIEERRINDDADDEALWRQFIVGTQSSSISSEHGIDDARTNASTTGHGTITAAPSLFNISGLGTSDEANPGNSQWVDSSVQSAGPSRTSSHGSDARSIDAEYDAQSKDRDAATHDGRDVESIEDVQSPTFHNEASFNIHSTPLRVLNPHRFKKPSKPRCEPGQKANLFRLPRR